MATDTPKIILYTNHACPWAHRAHIVLKELGLQYEEVIIDLSKPREPWYLEVNPASENPTAPRAFALKQDPTLANHRTLFVCSVAWFRLYPITAK
jgi:glutaredoxin